MTAHREFPHKKDGVDYDYDKPPSFSDRGDDAIVAKTFFWEIEQAGSNSTFFPLSELYTSKTGILPVLKIVLLCATTADTRTLPASSSFLPSFKKGVTGVRVYKSEFDTASFLPPSTL